MLIDLFGDEIIELINQKKTQSEICFFLKAKYGNIKGISERSIRRFISNNNLLNKINNNDLIDVVSQVISNVGPSYGRSMLTGALRSLNVNACRDRVAKAAILADPNSHQQRLEVKFIFNIIFHYLFKNLIFRIKQDALIRCHIMPNILDTNFILT